MASYLCNKLFSNSTISIKKIIQNSLPLNRNHWWSKTNGTKNDKIVRPGHYVVTNQIHPDIFPPQVILPPYAKSGIPPPISNSMKPEIKSNDEIKKMKTACQLARKVLITAGESLRVGMTTDEIDQLVLELCIEHHAYPSPLNYRGFPKAVCTSVNNVICHGIPDSRPLVDGDIINVDITVYLEGVHGDCSKTFFVGDVDEEGKHLVAVTEECLQIGVNLCKPETKFSDIGEAIYYHAQESGFEVIGEFTGHGIGKYFHGPPDIYHVPNDYPGTMLPGMTFTIEPILSEGSDRMTILKDGWTAITCDNSRAAQCEHTVLITESGVEILTL